MDYLNEKLLAAWIKLSTVVVNTRLVSALSYNEALVCRLLYTHMEQDDKKPLNATALCKHTGMLKSQMNRTLSTLESKALIIRRRNALDKRQIDVLFNPQQAHIFRQQHVRLLTLVDGIIARMGVEEASQATVALESLATAAATQLREQERSDLT